MPEFYWDYIGVILGLYWDYIGVMLGLYWGYIGVIYRDNGKENGNYCNQERILLAWSLGF